MDSQVSQLTLGLLPESRTRWGRFVVSYGMQSVVVTVFVIAAIAHPEVLVLPAHDYHFVSLVDTPPPIPQKPAPVKNFPAPKVAEAVTPRPEALRVPAELVPRKTPPLAEIQPPKVTVAASPEILPDARPEIGRASCRERV